MSALSEIVVSAEELRDAMEALHAQLAVDETQDTAVLHDDICVAAERLLAKLGLAPKTEKDFAREIAKSQAKIGRKKKK